MATKDEPLRLDRAAFMTETGQTTAIGILKGSVAAWRTENESVAVVDGNGAVTATGKGDTMVWALSEAGAEAGCRVSVGYGGGNPILPPTWGLFVADGEPHVFDGVMYIYGSRDNPYGKNREGKVDFCSSDYHTLYSKDLLHWTDAGVSVSAADVPGDISLLWAPDLFRAPGRDKYYLAFCSTDRVGTYFIGESDIPTGPFGNIREITYKGERIGNIDPGLLVDGDRVYMAMPKPFRIGELDRETDYSSVKEDSLIMVEPVIEQADDGYYGFEGPSLRKFGDFYYFIYIASPRDERHPIRMNYLISRDIREGWRFGGTIIDTSGYLDSINVHGSIERFGDDFYLAYHRCAPGMGVINRHGKKVSMTREMSLEKIAVDGKTGEIRQAEITSSGVRDAFAAGEKIYGSTAVFFSESGRNDRFIAREIGGGEEYFPPRFSGYPLVTFEKAGEYLGFRYIRSNGSGGLTARIKTEAPGAVLSWIDCSGNGILKRVELPDTRGKWEEVGAVGFPLSSGKMELRIELEKMPEKGRVEFDWFRMEIEKTG